MLTNTFTRRLLAGALLLTAPATFAQTTGTPDPLIVGAYPVKIVKSVHVQTTSPEPTTSVRLLTLGN